MTISKHEVETRPSAGADAIVTNLSINWEGMTEEDVRTLAAQALVVKLQGNWRKNGIPAENGIPAGDHEVKAVDFKPGTRAPRQKLTVEQMLAALGAEERAALLAKYLEG
jgi:hypothetical protein